MTEETNEKNKLQEVLAEEIVEKIRKGEKVEYENVYIKGSLILSQFDLPVDENDRVVIKSDICIKYSRIEGKIDLRRSIFSNSVNISSTNIYGDAFFSQTTFHKEVDFTASQFNASASFAGTHFMRKAIFCATRFMKSASFNSAKFELESQFDNANFNLDVHFETVTFFEYAYFNRAKFGEEANFRGTTFLRNVEFKEARFNENVYFGGAKLKNANFSMAEFRSDVYLNDAIFNGIVDFNKCQFNNRIFVPWDSIKRHLIYDGSTYLFLIKNYNNLEKFDDADKCYYQYRIQRRRTLNIKERLSDSIPLLALGYGVHPEYPLIIGGLIIIVFAAIYSLGYPTYSMQNATILSAAIFATQTRMESTAGLYYILSIIEGIAGVILMACFVVSLAKKTLK